MIIPDGIRTHNLRLRKPTPCPLGHWDCLAAAGVGSSEDGPVRQASLLEYSAKR